jgi:hypothetical protein
LKGVVVVAIDGLGYAILAGMLLAIGGSVGWVSGSLLSWVLRSKRNGLVEVLSGMVGFSLGIYVSFVGFSVDEEWYDGNLVSRHVGGWANHFALIAIVSSVALVTIVKISPHIWSFLFRKHQS